MTGIATISFKDIPPFLLVSGNTAKPYGLNVRGLKKRGFSDSTIRALRTAYKTVYRSKKNISEATSDLKQLAQEFPEVQNFIDFGRFAWFQPDNKTERAQTRRYI